MSRLALACLAAVLCFAIQAQDTMEARLVSVEKVMDRFYRGERLEKAIERSNADIQTYNAKALAKQAELEKQRQELEQVIAPIEAARSQLKALDDDLKRSAGQVSQDTMKTKVEARNALVRHINELSTKARGFTDAYNTLARQTQVSLDQIRLQAMKLQSDVNARLDAFTAFTKAGQDVALFTSLNQMLVEVRQGLRDSPENAALVASLKKIRSLRRELATWTLVGQSLKTNGLVIVEAMVLDEPCWFIVDTGAMDTIVSEEILGAIGHRANLSKVASLSVVGGTRVTGLVCRLPSLTVSGQTRLGVPASAVPPFDVGIDGLLGQSFLKAFVYTIDERNPVKLILTPKEDGISP